MTDPPDPTQAAHDTAAGKQPTAHETVRQTPAEGARSAELSAPDAPPGYDLHDELGRGGMGVVYRATQRGLNRTVALKMLRPDGAADGKDLIRFLAEAEAVAAVRHPHVVQVYEFGEHAGRSYMVLEYCDGGSLADRLKAAGRMAPAAAAVLVATLADAVQAAHDRGIVHRDLKPGNILFDSGANGRREPAGATHAGDPGPEEAPAGSRRPFATPLPKVADFGLAKRTAGDSDLTRTHAVMGTPAYMAPEQATGRAKFVGPAADVYALGVILYECLTGKRPFDADDAFAVLRMVAEDDPPRPRSRVPGLPRDLELVCLKCLAKNPQERYASAAELADDLRAFLDGRPVRATSPGAGERAVRWARRNPTRAALVAVLALLILGGPPVVVWNQARLDARQRVAEQADLARAAAEKAAAAAERLAVAQKQFAVTARTAARTRERPPGWTWANAADLVGLADPDPAAAAELQSVAAQTLLATDVRPAGQFAPGMTAAVAAPSRDGGLVALGEFKAQAFRLPVRVWLVDPATGKTVRNLAFTPSWPPNLLKPGQDGAKAIAFAPDGRTVLAGTRYGRVVRWATDSDAAKPAADWAAGAADESIDHLAVSRDGRAVFSGGRRVKRWDAATGRQEAARDLSPAGMVVDPARGAVLVAAGGRLHRLDPATLADAIPPVPLPRGDGPLAADPGGRLLAVAGGRSLAIYDPVRLAPVVALADPELRADAHTEPPTALAFSPDGTLLASAAAAAAGRDLKLWEVVSGRLVGSAAVPGTDPIALAWAGDGRTVFATAAGHALRFEVARPAAAAVVAVQPTPVAAARFAPDGAVLTAGEPVAEAGKYVVPLRRVGAEGTGEGQLEIPASAPDGGKPGLAADPLTGRVAVTAGRGGVWAWEPDCGKAGPLAAATDPTCPRFAPDGRTLWAITDGKRAQSWAADTLASGPAFDNSPANVMSGLPGVDALAAGRRTILVGRRDGQVTVLDPRTAAVAAGFPRSGDPVTSVALGPDDRQAVAGSQQGLLRLIDLAGGREHDPQPAHAGAVTAVTISCDGSWLATGGKDRTVRLWRPAGGRCEPWFAVAGLPTAVRDLEFAPTDDRLLVRLAGECGVRVWDVAKLRQEFARLGLGE